MRKKMDLIIKAFCQRYMENGKSLISKGSIQHPEGKALNTDNIKTRTG